MRQLAILLLSGLIILTVAFYTMLHCLGIIGLWIIEFSAHFLRAGALKTRTVLIALISLE